MDERQLNALLARLAEMLQGVRQYIGARYVPNFKDDPWNDTTQYEPLDVVDNGMGTSYIAKKPVPAGTPLTDREYWFVYGNTSGAIINLQNQIDAIVNTTIPGINSEIEALKTPPILCFGDSFATISNSWVPKLANLMNNPIYHKELSGTGFVGNVGTSWNNLVTEAAADSDIPNEDIRLIIFAGGTNDVGKSGVKTAMEGAISNAKTNFPNADIMVIFMSFYPHKMSTVASMIDTYVDVCQSEGIRFNDISTNIKITKDAVDADKNHPTAIGETVIAGCIYNLIKGNKITPYNSFVGLGSAPILVSVQGDTARFESHSTLSISWSTDTAITLTGTPHFDLNLDGESDGYIGILERDNENYIWGNTIGYFQWGGNYHLCDMAFRITENKLEIHPRCIESGQYLNVPANTNGTLEISRISTTFPSNFL